MALILKEDADLLAKVFRVGIHEGTVAPPPARGEASDPFVQLDDLAGELKSEAAAAGDPLARWADLSSRRSLFDRALFGRLSISEAPAVDFLVACYRRGCYYRSSKSRDGPPDEIYVYLLELCVSYTAIALLNASMFPQPAEVVSEGPVRLLPALKKDGADGALPDGFFKALVTRMQEDGNLNEFASPLLEKLATQVRSLNVLDDELIPALRGLLAMLREKPLAASFAGSARWLGGAVTGHQLETRSGLGAFFAVSCFPSSPRIAQICFQQLTAPVVDSDFRSMRMSLQVLQNALKSISTELLKNADAKEPFFKMVAAVCSFNQVRAQQYFRHSETQRLFHLLEPDRTEPPQMQIASTDGMLINMGAVLLQMCDPFTAPNSPHAAKIDGTYLLSTHRLQLEKETKLCATADDVMYWLDPRNPDLRRRYLERMADEMVEPDPEDAAALTVSASFGTISEYFFLTMRLLHVGLLSSFTVFAELSKEHGRLKQEQDRLESELQRMRHFSSGSPMLGQLEGEIERLKKIVETIKRNLLCYQAQLLEPQLLASCIRYYRLVARWLVASASPPASGLPLPHKVPRLFAALPEFCMDDIAQFLKHLTNVAPQVLEEVAIEELHDFLTLMVTFIGSPRYVKNPYLRATFTKLLRYLVPRSEDNEQTGAHGSERLAQVFHGHELAMKHLPQALMGFFVDIEFTGAHTQAYDKYEYRLEMSQILEYFWDLPPYRASMVAFTRDTPRFVRFVNMLINDSIYSMDEALSKLEKIRNTQAEMADETTWMAQPRQQLQQRTQAHTQDEGHCRYFLLFTSEVLHMMEYLSAHPEIAPVFMLPELVERIASMLNHFLVKLVGDKNKDLKVKNPEKYHFDPVKLLNFVAKIITHFAPLPEFGQAVVRDDRSYDQKNMRKAIKVLSSKMVMAHEALVAFESFCNKCIELKAIEEEEEAELGDVPDEFCCEITADIMEDPVTLPSGKVCDRKNICRHLLSDETDPFSRKRLTPDMLVPDSELKARIEAFRREKRANRVAQAMEVG